MPHDAQLQLARRGKEGTRVVLLGDPPHTEEIGRPSDALVKAVCIGDVSSVTSATELAVALRDRGVEAPVCVDGEDGFAIMHQAPDQQLLFVLNPETARTTFSLRFASSRVLALRPLASEGPDVPVADQTARITLAPHTGT